MQALRQDLRQAFRPLRRNPGFALTAIATLALGIGATVAVFSVAYAVLIDPFPRKDVHALATPQLCSSKYPRCYWDVYTPEQFLEIERNSDVFSGITASTITYVTLTGGREPERVRDNYIAPNTFDVLGAQPIVGWASAMSDVQPGHGAVALLSYRYWQAHFGGSTTVLGRMMVIDHQPRTIIGVMPPRFLWRGGIRMALGANRGHITWLILRQAIMLALLGIAIGLPLVFIAGRPAKQELFNTSQYDPVVILASVIVLPLLAIAGTWFPARRASGIDPVRALRTD